MGGIFQLPVVETKNLARTLHDLKSRNVRCIAAHPRPKGKTLAECDLTTSCCILLGSEGYGLSEAILTSCDESVTIPMTDSTDSLNVGSAAAVFLYETQRQRKSA
jgi:tRNA G18 (ribose-2'-O)-methylase SpoU